MIKKDRLKSLTLRKRAERDFDRRFCRKNAKSINRY